MSLDKLRKVVEVYTPHDDNAKIREYRSEALELLVSQAHENGIADNESDLEALMRAYRTSAQSFGDSMSEFNPDAYTLAVAIRDRTNKRNIALGKDVTSTDTVCLALFKAAQKQLMEALQRKVHAAAIADGDTDLAKQVLDKFFLNKLEIQAAKHMGIAETVRSTTFKGSAAIAMRNAKESLSRCGFL